MHLIIFFRMTFCQLNYFSSCILYKMKFILYKNHIFYDIKLKLDRTPHRLLLFMSVVWKCVHVVPILWGLRCTPDISFFFFFYVRFKCISIPCIKRFAYYKYFTITSSKFRENQDFFLDFKFDIMSMSAKCILGLTILEFWKYIFLVLHIKLTDTTLNGPTSP